MPPLMFPTIEADTPALILAPMEGVTDAPMRALLTELGGFSFCVTEFLRITNNVPGPRCFRNHAPEFANDFRTPSGVAVQIQFLGGDPDRLALAALTAVRIGALAVDLNFGCPAPTVNRHDGGAILLNHPDRIRKIVETVRSTLPPEIPVSAKLRLGWDDPCAIHENAACAAEGGATWITIHGRTRFQGYQPPAYWKPIGEVRRRLGIPVVANGEIRTVQDLRRCRDETGCQHFMIGRGALTSPWLARDIACELGIPVAEPIPSFGNTPAEWLPLLRRFVEINRAMGSPSRYTLTRIKQWLRMADGEGQRPWIEELKRVQDLRNLFHHLESLEGHEVSARSSCLSDYPAISP